MITLENYIIKSGYKKSYIAKQLGIAPQTFNKRLNGTRRFYYKEVCCLIELLDIPEEDAKVLFE